MIFADAICYLGIGIIVWLYIIITIAISVAAGIVAARGIK